MKGKDVFRFRSNQRLTIRLCLRREKESRRKLHQQNLARFLLRFEALLSPVFGLADGPHTPPPPFDVPLLLLPRAAEHWQPGTAVQWNSVQLTTRGFVNAKWSFLFPPSPPYTPARFFFPLPRSGQKVTFLLEKSFCQFCVALWLHGGLNHYHNWT